MIKAIIFDWVGTLYQFRRKGLFPYSEMVLRKLYPKYKLAVISNALPEDLERRSEQIKEIKKYFDVAIVDTGKTQEQFMECMRKLGVKPENTLVVGDNTIREIKIGNQLGCQTYWIKNGKHADEIPNEKTGQPTRIINSVEELLNIL